MARNQRDDRASDRRKRKSSPKRKDYDREDRRPDRDREEHGDRMSSLNDISWYSKYPALIAAAGKIPFPYKPGMSVPALNTGWTSPSTMNYNIPGVMKIAWAPSVGNSSKQTDPASIIAKEIYGKVREAFSGELAADPPDFVLYLLALDSVFSYIGALKRVFRVLQAYNPNNYQVPGALLQALGISESCAQALRSNRPRFFQAINELVGMTRKLRCPAIMDYFNRHYWLNDNVYTDAPEPNSQMYVFTQHVFMQYVWEGDPTVGALQPIQTPLMGGNLPSGYSDWVEYLKEFGTNLIDSMCSKEETYIISGYLTRAYADAPVFAVDELRWEELLTPVYVPEVLTQIENARAIPGFAINANVNSTGLAFLKITQDPTANVVKANYTYSIANATTGVIGEYVANTWMNPTVNLRMEDPSAADVIIATRMQSNISNIQQSGTTLSFTIECASEIVLGMGMFNNYATGGSSGINVLPYTLVCDLVKPDSVTNSQASSIYAMMDLAAYDWAPYFPIFIRRVSGSFSVGLSCDAHNITTFSVHQMRELNRACMYSEFNAFQ